MLGIRQKLSLGFGGLLVIILVIGAQSILHLTKLGRSIDVILRENYRSVVACQQMKEALERTDSGVLFILMGYTEEGTKLVRENELAFEKELEIELGNITVPGEGERAARLQQLFSQYQRTLDGVLDPKIPLAARRASYFTSFLPLFDQIKNTADEILQLNQQNMNDANEIARTSAAAARQRMYLYLLIGTIVAVGFMIFAGRWILGPINRLIESADDIRRGNLDLVVQSTSRDEIGHLSEAFNAMAASLREFRRSDQARLVRIQRATQQAFDSLPEAIAAIDMHGSVELATETAKTVFGLRPGSQISDSSLRWIVDLYNDVLKGGAATSKQNDRRFVQHFVNGEERYFRPQAVPILDSERLPIGIVLTLQDVTQLRQQDELRKGVISTVSHQLKTPLTSIRMAIHLLLEEKVGPLTEKQVELLLAAGEDSNRLHGILSNLLDISRIESGRAQLELRAISSRAMVSEALDPFHRAAQDQGVTMSVEVPDDLPDVWVDTTRIGHVFGNLVSNALKFTPAGGRVSVSATAEEKTVRFSISDTGKGIPSKYLPRVFEQFFRVPDQGTETGAGLGLAIVKEIVKAHGGVVGVESREGRGTTFTFTLRRADRTPEKESQS
ncbi:MAG: ATP-binding protein [Candidatus Eisenbacteria bacterium]|nr:ATP-binding protein [Candidatus Eisenbacteria bacterium]